jgi:DNA-binding CsgD family transcriptional regulator
MPPSTLSPREIECLTLAARSKSNKEIGDKLGLSPQTVGQYIDRVKVKLGAGSRTEAIVIAMTASLIEP